MDELPHSVSGFAATEGKIVKGYRPHKTKAEAAVAIVGRVAAARATRAFSASRATIRHGSPGTRRSMDLSDLWQVALHSSTDTSPIPTPTFPLRSYSPLPFAVFVFTACVVPLAFPLCHATPSAVSAPA